MRGPLPSRAYKGKFLKSVPQIRQSTQNSVGTFDAILPNTLYIVYALVRGHILDIQLVALRP